MLNFHNSTKTVYVKGFAQTPHFKELVSPSECTGEFIAVLTDLECSRPVDITAASMEDGCWHLTCTDGSILVYPPEPKTPRRFKLARIIFNLERGFLGVFTYDTVMPEDYDKIEENIQNGVKYRLSGFPEAPNSEEIITGALTKFWIDSDGNHAITRSGSHYIF